MEFLENLFEDGILKIKFGILGFWKFWKMVILEILKNGNFGKLFEKWNFGKLNLRIGTLENYFENEI